MVIPISASKITRTRGMPTDVSGHKIRNIAVTGNCNRDKNTESQKMSIGNFYDWRHQTTQKTSLASLIKIDRLTFLQEIEIRKTMYLQFKLQIVGGASDSPSCLRGLPYGSQTAIDGTENILAIGAGAAGSNKRN